MTKEEFGSLKDGDTVLYLNNNTVYIYTGSEILDPVSGIYYLNFFPRNPIYSSPITIMCTANKDIKEEILTRFVSFDAHRYKNVRKFLRRLDYV